MTVELLVFGASFEVVAGADERAIPSDDCQRATIPGVDQETYVQRNPSPRVSAVTLMTFFTIINS